MKIPARAEEAINASRILLFKFCFELLKKFNSYDPNHIPAKAKVNVTVNCSCGNSQISKDYGLFVIYPLRSMDTLEKITNESKLDEGLIQNFNPNVNFSRGSGIVFIPGRCGEYETSGSSGYGTGSAAGLTGIMVAKSTEFSYQELAKSTNNFSLDNKIGQGGFGVVYYAEL
ncbi:hypothetical protein RYX36_027415 [Vicia faba]